MSILCDHIMLDDHAVFIDTCRAATGSTYVFHVWMLSRYTLKQVTADQF